METKDISYHTWYDVADDEIVMLVPGGAIYAIHSKSNTGSNMYRPCFVPLDMYTSLQLKDLIAENN